MPYPPWSYYPHDERVPKWVSDIVATGAAIEPSVSTLGSNGLSSDDVRSQFAPGLQDLDFLVEASKAKTDRIRRPLPYGENGKETVSFETDAFHNARWGMPWRSRPGAEPRVTSITVTSSEPP